MQDVLGFPGSFDNVQSPLFFNRTEVQTAIHAPHIEWEECGGVRFVLPPVRLSASLLKCLLSRFSEAVTAVLRRRSVCWAP